MKKKDENRINEIIDAMYNSKKIYTFKCYSHMSPFIVKGYISGVEMCNDMVHFDIITTFYEKMANISFSDIFFENELDKLQKRIDQIELNRLKIYIPNLKKELNDVEKEYKFLKEKYNIKE